LSPRGRTVLELALRESLDEGGRGITHRHVLLGILREGKGVGAQIIAAREPDLDAVIAHVREAKPPGPQAGMTLVTGPGPRPVPRPFRVVQLEGDAEKWERHLNDLAELGYALVELVDGRAIFTAAPGHPLEPAA
jgi:hypothetical protein